MYEIFIFIPPIIVICANQFFFLINYFFRYPMSISKGLHQVWVKRLILILSSANKMASPFASIFSSLNHVRTYSLRGVPYHLQYAGRSYYDCFKFHFKFGTASKCVKFSNYLAVLQALYHAGFPL